jgi:hypothetical protein
MFMIVLITRYHACGSNGSLLIAIKSKSECKIRAFHNVGVYSTKEKKRNVIKVTALFCAALILLPHQKFARP